MAKLTGRERVFSKGEHLISTTDRHGTITYANQSFADIAGYQQQELLGLQHNVVRHPSMPKAAFGELWSHLKQGKSWMGMVCNRSKNGDHYWVDAYVTPVYKNGHVEGYQSVRVKPDNEHLNTAQKLYKKITTGSAISNVVSNLSLTMVGKIMLAYLLSMVPVFIISIESASKESLPTVIGAMIFSVIFAYIAARLIQLPYKRATDKTRSIFDSEIARKVYTKRNDELGQLQLTIKVLQAEIETILSRVGGTADELNKVTATTSNEVDKTNASVLQQRIELESVSTAVHEMSATIEEVARNTVQTSDSAQQAEQEVMDGYAVVDETVASIENLAQQVQQAASVISKLQEDSDAIGSVIGVIRSIAEQTNLLALNAAIEAARAGEQGRGFAVVADEVRTLASQTQESTEQIETIIARLQQSTSEAVEEMVAGQDKAIGCVDQAERAGEALQAIGKAVAVIKDMTMQNASASEQQSVVAEEINRNINQISHVANETSEASETTAKATDNLVNQVMNMRDMIQQFKR